MEAGRGHGPPLPGQHVEAHLYIGSWPDRWWSFSQLATSTAVVFLSEGTQLGGCCTDMWLWSTYLKKPVGEKIFKVYVPLFVSTEALAWKGYVVSVCSSEQRFRCESVPCG